MSVILAERNLNRIVEIGEGTVAAHIEIAPTTLLLPPLLATATVCFSASTMFPDPITGLIAFWVTMKDNPSLLDGWIE